MSLSDDLSSLGGSFWRGRRLKRNLQPAAPPTASNINFNTFIHPIHLLSIPTKLDLFCPTRTAHHGRPGQIAAPRTHKGTSQHPAIRPYPCFSQLCTVDTFTTLVLRSSTNQQCTVTMFDILDDFQPDATETRQQDPSTAIKRTQAGRILPSKIGHGGRCHGRIQKV